MKQNANLKGESKINIEIGGFYANDHIYENGKSDKNIILLLCKSKVETTN